MVITTISSLLLFGCQGCADTPPGQGDPVSGEIEYRIGQSAKGDQVPQLEAATNFSFRQGETLNTPQLSLQPREGLAPQVSHEVPGIRASSRGRLRLSSSPALVNLQRDRAAATIAQPVRQVSDFDAQLSISAPMESTGLGFDVGVVPRLSVSKDGPFKQRSVGGELRIGQNFDKRGTDAYAGSWYLFAGADGEALVYEPDGDRNLTNRMALRDQVTVGDMQAGVSFTRGKGQLSLSYIHREVEYSERGLKGQRAAEDFAGVSFTLRR